MTPPIQVLLATYNGAPYLAAQLDSLFAQTYRDWELLVRDDGSSDETLSILEVYCRRHPDRIRRLDGGTRSGPAGNFARLLEASTSPYVLFSDQDDLWLPEKIELTLAKMRELERAVGADRPLLVHTDLRVVDDRLEVLEESLWAYQCSNPEKGAALNRLLLQNVATGCSVMVNRPLRELGLPIPSSAMMHDWWLALIASSLGKIGAVPLPTALYRQHGRNQLGARSGGTFASTLRAALNPGETRQRFVTYRAVGARLRAQAEAFLAAFGDRLTERQRQTVFCFARAPSFGPLTRRRHMLQYRLFYWGFFRNAVRFLTL